MNKIKGLILLGALFLGPIFAPAAHGATPLQVETAAGTFILPLQVAKVTELYSFKEGRGFPALETVLWTKGTWEATGGAAAVIGTDVNVPFLGVQKKLSARFFDTSNNDIRFGAWVGKPSQRLEPDAKARWIWGVKASVPLW